MSLVLYHHPYSRAATVLWMLEELGVDYELRFVDLTTGAHKAPELLALNPMGKLPILTDGDQVVTEPVEIPRISGVKIAENAKLEPVVTVHVYVGATDDELKTAREQAVRLYEETRSAVRG